MNSAVISTIIALGIVIALIAIACVLSFVVYRIIFAKTVNDKISSMSEGGDKTDMSDYFTEQYRNERHNLKYDD